MKITREKPDITRVIYRQEREDEHYGSCLWAFFDFDPDRGMLSIQSDCGDYAHRWPERGDEFWKLCAGMGGDYLIRKLCGKPREVNQEATIDTVKEVLEDAEFYKDEELNKMKIKSVMESLDMLYADFDCADEVGLAQYLLEQWNDDNGNPLDCAWEYVAADYAAQQERIVQIYEEHIRPEIVKIIQERNKCIRE